MENTYLLTDSFATQRHTQFLTTMDTYDQAELPPLIIDLERVNTTLKANRWQNNKRNHSRLCSIEAEMRYWSWKVAKGELSQH